jgi:hypothetical protein
MDNNQTAGSTIPLKIELLEKKAERWCDKNANI